MMMPHNPNSYICFSMAFVSPHYQKADKKARFEFFKKDRYLVKTPWWLRKLYPGCVWNIPSKENALFLTFDDGPHPTITPFVLDQLKKYNAKATFFCIGENVTRYPDIFQRIIDEGHAVGNHTHRHMNGWKTKNAPYIDDINKARQYIPGNLFRPPYGRIKHSQIKSLQKSNDKLIIVMWNILPGDWDNSVYPRQCLERITDKASSGDIIVFHDSEKAWKRMSYCLPRVLEYFAEIEYSFRKITIPEGQD
jgi:peptidoglycan-N-acetylglucosamine deacetylase